MLRSLIQFVIRSLFFIGVFCLVMTVPLAVFATDAAIGGEPDSPWWQKLIVTVFVGFGSTILGLIGKALTMLFDWLAVKIGWARLRLVDDLVMDEVTALYNKEVEHAKAANADGKLTEAEKAKFAQIAIGHVKGLFSFAFIKKLIAFLGSETKVDEMISKKVEKAVTAAKNAGKMARSTEIAKAIGAAANPPKP